MQPHQMHKVFLIASTFVLLILGLSSWTVINKFTESAREEVRQSLTAVLDTSYQATRSWVQDQRNTVKLWANFARTQQLVEQFLQLPRSKEILVNSPVQTEMREFLKPMLKVMGYQGYLVIDPNHINIASSRDQNIGVVTLLSKQEKFFQKILAGESALSLPEKSEVPLPDADGKVKQSLPTMFVGAPVYDSTGNIIAVFAFRLNPFTAFTNTLQQGRIGKTGETYAFDEEARLISNSRFDQYLIDVGLLNKDQKAILNIEIRDPGNVHPGGETKTNPPERPLTRMAASAISGNSSVDVDGYHNYRGIELVGAWHWDSSMGFGLATEMDKTEAYQAVRVYQFVIVSLTVAVGLLLIGLMMFFLLYYKRKLAEQQWRESEARIRLLLESVGEGVFGVDLQGNCTFVNSTALKLLGYNNASELTGKYIHPIIHHTKENGNPCNDKECKIYSAFRDGTSYYVDDEVLWRSDNTSFNVEYRSTPIYQNGQITGSVASFADITARREAEHSLRQSELRYRQVFNSISDVYAEIDLDGTILEVSPSVTTHTQYTRDELLGRFMGDFYARPKDREILLERIYKDGTINDFEALMILKDGTQKPFSFTGKVITDNTGKPLKLAGIMRDITVRKQAEELLKKGTKELETRVQERTRKLESANIVLKHEIEERKLAESALRENEQFIQTVLNTLPDSIAVIDSKGNILSVNKAWNTFANENNNEGLINSSTGLNYLEVCRNATGVSSKEADEVLKGINDLTSGKINHFSIEYPCHSPDKKRWFVMHAIPFYDGEMGIVITHTDITERKLSEEAIRAERDRAQRYLDTVEAIIVSLDRDGNINLINRRGCEILGYTEQELLGKNWFTTCIPEKDRDEVIAVFKKISAGDDSFSEYFENSVLTRDGRERMIAWHNSYFVDADGKFTATLGAGEDITDRVQAEERARQHQAEVAHLARLNIAGEMATGIAHELNQPLSAIVTYADVALRMVNSDQIKQHKLSEALEGARNQANRAAEIIRRLRQLVAKQPPKKKKNSLNDLIKESINLANSELRKNHINYKLELDRTLPMIMMDSIQIEQVLLNLINNSVDAMQQTPTPNRELTISTSVVKGNFAQATIIDNGPGIDEPTQLKMFEPFFTSKGEKGMGLGLSISRSIIEDHHGVLTVESKPGQGAKFSFTLPLNGKY